MFNLIVSVECGNGFSGYESRMDIYNNMTVKEFGEKIAYLSKTYVLVYDGCVNHDGVFCDMKLTAVERRV